MVEVAVGGRRQLERAEADVVQGLVVDAERLVRVLDQLVDGQRGVVRLHHHVRHLNTHRGVVLDAVHCYRRGVVYVCVSADGPWTLSTAPPPRPTPDS